MKAKSIKDRVLKKLLAMRRFTQSVMATDVHRERPIAIEEVDGRVRMAVVKKWKRLKPDIATEVELKYVTPHTDGVYYGGFNFVKRTIVYRQRGIARLFYFVDVEHALLRTGVLS